MSGALSGFGMTSQRTRTRRIERLREQGIVDEDVLAAIAAVPRHVFVEEALASRAYEDTALPLGFSQTISQPYVVARMIEAVLAGREQLGRTLEIGAGCGYQAAVLAQLTDEVYAVERIEPLLAKAKLNLRAIQQFKGITDPDIQPGVIVQPQVLNGQARHIRAQFNGFNIFKRQKFETGLSQGSGAKP